MAGQNLEDEMSRFEREIASANAEQAAVTQTSSLPPSIVIGSNTFTSVQEQLSSLRAQVQSNRNVSGQPNSIPASNNTNSAPRTTVPSLTRPPAPPTLNGSSSSSVAMPFMPPQIRSRPPPPNTQNSFMRPPMGLPPQMRPPQSVTVTNPSLSGAPVRYTDNNKPPNRPPTLQQTKVVYAAKPVLNKPHAASASSTSQAAKDVNPAAPASGSDSGRKRELDDQSSSLLPGEGSSTGAEAQQQSAPPSKKEKKKKEKKFIRMAANDVWEDASLADWDPNDFRVFCGDLGNEVTDEKLAEAFKKYPSLQKTKVIRDRRTHKTKGFGFISFKDPADYTRAMREMNGKYVGNRPIKLRKSNWKDRNVEVVKKKEKEKKRLGFR